MIGAVIVLFSVAIRMTIKLMVVAVRLSIFMVMVLVALGVSMFGLVGLGSRRPVRMPRLRL